MSLQNFAQNLKNLVDELNATREADSVLIATEAMIFGSFAGAAFLVLLPVVLKNVLVAWLGWLTDLAAHLEFLICGGLVITFLILGSLRWTPTCVRCRQVAASSSAKPTGSGSASVISVFAVRELR